MSEFFNRAEQMATFIKGLFDDGEVEVMVDFQKDLKSQFDKHVGRVKGGVMIVEWRGVSSTDRDLNHLRAKSTYVIHVICKPIIREKEGLLRADELVEKAAASLHHWHPEPGTPFCNDTRFEVVSVLPVNHPQYVIYTITGEMKIQLVKPNI